MRLGIITILLVSSCVCGFSQESRKTDLQEEQKPIGCEGNSAYLVRAADSLRNAKPDSVIIAVARLGTGEAATSLNRRRLFNVSFYLKTTLGVDAKRIVVAESEKIKGYGRVDLYVGGRLLETLLADRGKDLCVTCCGDYSDFYPERAKHNHHRMSQMTAVY
jgi:hypothetical protein